MRSPLHRHYDLFSLKSLTYPLEIIIHARGIMMTKGNIHMALFLGKLKCELVELALTSVPADMGSYTRFMQSKPVALADYIMQNCPTLCS